MNTRIQSQGGFSLIELVVIIVVTSIAAVSLLSLWGGIGRAAAGSEEAQTGAQIAQECAEHVLAQRRVNSLVGYAGITNAVCDALPAPAAGYARSVTVSAAASPPCPVAGQCNVVRVQVTRGLATVAEIRLMLADY